MPGPKVWTRGSPARTNPERFLGHFIGRVSEKPPTHNPERHSLRTFKGGTQQTRTGSGTIESRERRAEVEERGRPQEEQTKPGQVPLNTPTKDDPREGAPTSEPKTVSANISKAGELDKNTEEEKPGELPAFKKQPNN